MSSPRKSLKSELFFHSEEPHRSVWDFALAAGGYLVVIAFLWLVVWTQVAAPLGRLLPNGTAPVNAGWTQTR